MPTNSNQIIVRSKRKERRFYIDNEFLNGYAKKVGWNGQVVYMALCRHEKSGKAFPSLRHLASELNISPPSALRGVNKLQSYNIIKIIKDKKTSLLTYWLIDYLEWKKLSTKDWSNQSKSLS